MFTHVYIQNIRQYPGRQVTLKGWVVSAQPVGEALFLELRDGTGTIRCILTKKELPADQWAAAERLTPESSVKITGKAVDDGGRSASGHEIRAQALELIAEAPPIPASGNPRLWTRTPEGRAALRLRNAAHKAVTDYFDWTGFAHVDGTEPLAAAAFALGKVYRTGAPAGCPQESGIETAAAFIGLDEAMAVAEDFVSYLVHRLSTEQADDLRTLRRNPVPLNFVKTPFPRLEHGEAAALAAKEGAKAKAGEPLPPDALAVLSRKHERPVLVHRPPPAGAPALARTLKDAALTFTILAPEGYGTIGSGLEHETDPAGLERRLKSSGLSPEQAAVLLEACRHGAAPVAGFRIGLESFLAWLGGRA